MPLACNIKISEDRSKDAKEGRKGEGRNGVKLILSNYIKTSGLNCLVVRVLGYRSRRSPFQSHRCQRDSYCDWMSDTNRHSCDKVPGNNHAGVRCLLQGTVSTRTHIIRYRVAWKTVIRQVSRILARKTNLEGYIMSPSFYNDVSLSRLYNDESKHSI